MVSVIVPIYNAEKYLRKCIDSLVAQTYRDVEIILINDGSIDRSSDICRDYNKKFSNIVYIEQENKGEGGARNSGLKICKGDYVIFCDSDDELPPDSIEELMNNVCGVEMVVGGIEKKDTDSLIQYKPSPKHVLGRFDVLESACKDSYFINPICCKLFRRDIIIKNNIKFNDFKYGADTYFNYKYLRHVNSIKFISSIVYRVNVVDNSMSTRIVKNSWKYLKAQYDVLRDLLKEDDNIRHGILMNKIKAVLILECRISKESFLSTCSDIRSFLAIEEGNKYYKENVYNFLVYILLTTKHYGLLYQLIHIRVRLNIRL